MTMKLMPDRHVEVLEIEGMSCDHCVESVREALGGVSNAVVRSVEIGRAEVDAGPEATREQLVGAVEAVGFDVTGGTSEATPE